MDKKTRVLRALYGESVDRPPIGFWKHFDGSESKGEACVEAHVRFYENSGVDFLKIMSDGYFNYPIPADIVDASNWYELKPLGRNHPFIAEQVERARLVNERLKGECCTFYNVFAPFSSIRFGTSDELVMRHLKDNPEAVLHALNVIAQDNALLAELVITEGGCTGIYYCLQGGETERFTLEEYRGWITPSDRYALDHANRFSNNNLLHLCGWAGIKNRLEVWKDYPAKAVNWAAYVEEFELREGRPYFGGRTVLGGFDNRKGGVLFGGTEEEVKQATRELLSSAGSTGLMLGADCSLPLNIDVSRFRWVIEAASETTPSR